ncbi:pyocin knob domain-containing protein [Corynebacterium sp.]|uniref:pyocin knob domain-containing protein n=1 Tax=Corynebacterium sp. TaxID=1720 RepID=UPI0028AC5F95|nr:pyocin knob domain-containing protein [Corynebacterium sp.]
MATLTGKITDVTSRPPKSISSITVKAPSARIGSGTEVITSSPADVDFNSDTGDLTIGDLTGGLAWLYIEGDGWSDSIALAVAEGMITLVEAIANAAGIPGVADYIALLAELKTRIDAVAQGAVNEAADSIKWKQGKIPLNANLDTWSKDGDFEVDTFAVATSLTGRPNEITGAIGAAHFRQFTSTAGHKTQLWETYGNSVTAAVRVTRAKFGEHWQPWKKISDASDLAKTVMRRGSIPRDANLDTWAQDGQFDVASFSIAASLIGRPTGDALGAADFEQKTTGSGHKTQYWVRIQGDSGTPIELMRTKGASASSFTAWVPTTLTAAGLPWSRTDTIHMWGDSAVADGLAVKLNDEVPNSVVNRGGWGWTSNDVLLRAGIIVLSGIPVGGAIPASGDVQIDLLGQKFSTRPARTISASWAGIPGSLIHQQDETWIFRRTTAGTAVPITEFTPVISNDAGLTNSGTHIFLFAGNDILEDAGHAPDSNLEDHIVANYARAIEATRPAPTRYVLIGGVKSKSADEINSPEHQLTVSINNRLRSMFPAHFVDREAWLATRGMAAAGLTPSADDTEKMTAGMAPAGVMYDHTHVKPEVVAAEARELWATALKVRGWA